MISFNIAQRRNVRFSVAIEGIRYSPRDCLIGFCWVSVLLSSIVGSLPAFQGATLGSLPGWGFYFPRAWFFSALLCWGVTRRVLAAYLWF